MSVPQQTVSLFDDRRGRVASGAGRGVPRPAHSALRSAPKGPGGRSRRARPTAGVRRLQAVEERTDAVGDEGLLGGALERRGTAEMAADGRDLDVLRILEAGIEFARQISGDGAVSLAGQQQRLPGSAPAPPSCRRRTAPRRQSCARRGSELSARSRPRSDQPVPNAISAVWYGSGSFSVVR